MPFPLIPAALGLCFLLVWVFIGGMIFRDGQLAARSDRENDGSILPLIPLRSIAPADHAPRRGKTLRHDSTVRAAS